MKRSGIAVVATAGVLALAGCWASTVATETRSFENRPQAEVSPASNSSGEVRSQPANARPRERSMRPVSAPPPLTFQPGPTAEEILPSGALVLVRNWDEAPPTSTETAVLRLTIPIGTGSGETGTAQLTAWTVAEQAAAEDNEPSLRRRVEQLGGELNLRVGSRCTNFDVTIPTGAWREGMTALINAVRRPIESMQQLQTIRQRLLRAERRALAQTTVQSLLHTMTRTAGASPERYLDGLEDRTLDQVAIFQRLSYHPQGSVLTLWIPGETTGDVVAAARELTENWVGPDSSELVSQAPQAANVAEGIYWVPTPGDSCDFALVLPLPHLSERAGLEMLTLLECLTMDGVGGRLGETMRELGPREQVLYNRFYWDGTTRHLVLWTSAQRSEVFAAWAALQQAISSLGRQLPHPDEIRGAAQRLRLRLLAEYSDPNAWLESTSAQGLRAQRVADLSAMLSRLADPLNLDLLTAARELRPRPAALAVVGSEPPEDTRNAVVLVTRSLFDATSAEVPNETEEQIAAARPYLEAACKAAGGRGELVDLTGYSAELDRRTEDGIEVRELVWFRSPDRMRRVRRVLATPIETVIGSETVERAGGTEIDLEQSERVHLLRQTERHPIMLLAAWARGEMIFRLASLRKVDGRDMVLLELVDNSRERLRMMVDLDSSLVRQVIAQEWRPDLGARVEVTERHSDYRKVGTFRAPFFTSSSVDNGRRPVLMTYRQLLLKPPPERLLESGGPRRLFEEGR